MDQAPPLVPDPVPRATPASAPPVDVIRLDPDTLPLAAGPDHTWPVPDADGILGAALSPDGETAYVLSWQLVESAWRSGTLEQVQSGLAIVVGVLAAGLALWWLRPARWRATADTFGSLTNRGTLLRAAAVGLLGLLAAGVAWIEPPAAAVNALDLYQRAPRDISPMDRVRGIHRRPGVKPVYHYEPRLRAFDAATGRAHAEFPLPANAYGYPSAGRTLVSVSADGSRLVLAAGIEQHDADPRGPRLLSYLLVFDTAMRDLIAQQPFDTSPFETVRLEPDPHGRYLHRVESLGDRWRITRLSMRDLAPLAVAEAPPPPADSLLRRVMTRPDDSAWPSVVTRGHWWWSEDGRVVRLVGGPASRGRSSSPYREIDADGVPREPAEEVPPPAPEPLTVVEVTVDTGSVLRVETLQRPRISPSGGFRDMTARWLATDTPPAGPRWPVPFVLPSHKRVFDLEASPPALRFETQSPGRVLLGRDAALLLVPPPPDRSDIRSAFTQRLLTRLIRIGLVTGEVSAPRAVELVWPSGLRVPVHVPARQRAEADSLLITTGDLSRAVVFLGSRAAVFDFDVAVPRPAP